MANARDNEDGLNLNEPLDLKGRPDFQKVNEVFLLAEKMRSNARVEARNKICQAFYESRQYMRWDNELQEVIEDETLKRLSLWWNIIRSNVDLWAARATNFPKRLEAVPGPNRQSSLESGAISTAYIEKEFTRLRWANIEYQAAKLAQITGLAFPRLYWDPDGIDIIPLIVNDADAPPPDLPEDGEFEFIDRIPFKAVWLDLVRGPVGTFEMMLVHPNQVYVEPGTYDIRKADRVWLLDDKEPLSKILKAYPDAEGPPVIPEQTDDEDPGFRSRGHGIATNADEADAIDGEVFSERAGVARVHHLFQREGSQWRKISYLTKQDTDDQFMWLNPNEPLHEDHGLFQVRYTEIPEKFWTNGSVWDMLPMQISANHTFVSMMANHELASRPVAVSRGEVIFTPGEVCHTVEIPDEADGQDFQWQTIPNTSQDSMAVMGQMVEMADRTAVIHDVSTGNAPKDASGKAIELLISQQDIGPNKLAEELQAVGVQIAELLLSMTRKLVVETRLLPVTDSNRQMRLLTNGAIPAMTSVQPAFSPLIPRDKAGMLRSLGVLTDLGWFDPGNEERTAKMAKFLEMRPSEAGDMLPTMQRIRAMLERDIEEIESGNAVLSEVGEIIGNNGEPLAQDWNDHLAWLGEATSFMSSERYRDEWRELPEARQMFRALFDAHRGFLGIEDRPPDDAFVAAMMAINPELDPESAAVAWEELNAQAAETMAVATPEGAVER